MKIQLFQLDAFTQQLFRGNPGAVCPLEIWLDDDILQAIATENNLSATTFVVPRDNDYHIRWFTPEKEIDLCGHGTLISGHVVMNILEPGREHVIFQSSSGPLPVSKEAEGFVMDFPTHNYVACETPQLLIDALGLEPTAVFATKKYMVVLDTEEQLRQLTPNMDLMRKLDLTSVVVTAKGEHVDFVSRYFVPKEGINEDAVTGSAHCLLAPYWSERLGKIKLKAQQLSKRGGELHCEVKGDRVLLSGFVKPYLSGMIELS